MMLENDKSPSAACRAFAADLVLHYYGELDGASQIRLDKHLAGCDSCRQSLSEMHAILPLTVKPDEPPVSFWNDYDRELRHKLSDAEQSRIFWWHRLPLSFQPWTLPALAAVAIVVLALTFTLERGPSLVPDAPPRDELFMEVLPMAEKLEFYRTMEVLDAMDVLEFMGSQAKAKA